MSEWLKIMSEWLMLRLLKLPKPSTPAKSGGSSRELEQIKVDTSKSISASVSANLHQITHLPMPGIIMGK